jgi:hypothetical protein
MCKVTDFSYVVFRLQFSELFLLQEKCEYNIVLSLRF